jgi:endonuclease/exonuclease/phosphatase family metal-dependent hydrolase
LLLLGFISTFNAYGQGKPIRVMTFNIRYDNPADGINSWENRRKTVTENILSISPEMIGLQEVLKHQLDYLEENLPGYRSIGIGREDGRTKGEYVAVFYKYKRFRLLDNGTFWLSPTPSDTGSVGWDAALTRICTWGKFFDKSTGREIYFLNTHFDHMGDTARAESARLIMDFIKKQTQDLPVILTGDFNCSPDEEPYRILADDKNGMQDACRLANSPESCNEGTFNGFETTENLPRIDMVFVNGNWEVSSYEILKIKRGEMFISDHFPVVIGLNLKD